MKLGWLILAGLAIAALALWLCPPLWGALTFLVPGLRGLSKVHSNGSGAEQVKAGLADSQKRAGDLADQERATGEGLREQGESIDRASRAIDDGLSVLSDIAKRGPNS